MTSKAALDPSCQYKYIWGFLKLGLPFLRFRVRVPLMRMRVFGGLYWDPCILVNYHIASSKLCVLFPN